MRVSPQQHLVSIADLELKTVPAQEMVLNADKQVLTDFAHQGRVTALQVWKGLLLSEHFPLQTAVNHMLALCRSSSGAMAMSWLWLALLKGGLVECGLRFLLLQGQL